MIKSVNDFTLREKKYAKTKIALAAEFLERMKKTRLSDISIREVCQAVEVSEGTFYKYFPRKVDVICYFHKFTLLKVIWEIQGKKEKNDYLKLIEKVFDVMADEIREPFRFYEIISVYTLEQVRPDKGEDLSAAEKVFGLPDCPGIEATRILSLEDFFGELVTGAQKQKQLSAEFSVKDIVLSLLSMLIGIPLAIDMSDFDKLKKMYKVQLSLLWQGLSPQGRA